MIALLTSSALWVNLAGGACVGFVGACALVMACDFGRGTDGKER